MESIITVIMGLVEGLTEFIPVSSTGHLILAGELLGFDRWMGKEVADTFEVFIQLGAILAIVAVYPQRFAGLLRLEERNGFAGLRGIGLLLLTSFPALALGFLFHGIIKHQLFSTFTVAIGLGLGGLWILFVELSPPRPSKEGLDSLGWKEALGVGLFQCLALWPGMSRSASTILGGMLVRVDRRTATEYSFFAAVPIIVAASLYDLYKNLPVLKMAHFWVFALGTVVSFVTAWAAVKFFLRYLSRHTLSAFGYYRVTMATVVLWALWLMK